MTYYTQQYQPPPGTQVQSQPLKEEFTRITQSFDAVETDINGKLSTAGGTVSGAVTIIGALTQSGNAVDFGAATSMRVPAPQFENSPVRQSDLAAAAFGPLFLYPWDIINGTSHNAAAGRGCGVNNTTCDITLPANPTAGQFVPFADLTNQASSGAIWIRRNGQTIMGVAEDMQLDMNGRSFALQFINGSWRLV